MSPLDGVRVLDLTHQVDVSSAIVWLACDAARYVTA